VRPWGLVALALTSAVVSSVVCAALFEALTDRDWSVQGWEWPQVLACTAVLTLTLLWISAHRLSSASIGHGSIAKRLIKTGLEQVGYTIRRLPSPASDPRFALQFDFDYVLDHYLASRVDARTFFFVQVGAHDGVMDDPLHRRVRQGRWHGILIEPQALPFARLVENYVGLEGLTFVNAVVAERPGTRELYVIQDEDGETIESMSGAASLREEHLHRPFEFVAIPGSRIGSVEVVSTTFSELLSDITYLDLLQIDAESYDLELLKLFDFGRLTPPIVRFEHRQMSASELDEAYELLAQHGYRMVREEHDTTAYSPIAPRSSTLISRGRQSTTRQPAAAAITSSRSDWLAATGPGRRSAESRQH
jgi:FkbM family methyltransferase